jgi:hypothetical protein
MSLKFDIKKASLINSYSTTSGYVNVPEIELKADKDDYHFIFMNVGLFNNTSGGGTFTSLAIDGDIVDDTECRQDVSGGAGATQAGVLFCTYLRAGQVVTIQAKHDAGNGQIQAFGRTKLELIRVEDI